MSNTDLNRHMETLVCDLKEGERTHKEIQDILWSILVAGMGFTPEEAKGIKLAFNL